MGTGNSTWSTPLPTTAAYFLRAQQGALALNQRWEESGARYVKIICQPQGETPYLVSLEECFEDWFDRGLEFDSWNRRHRRKKQEFCAFAWSLPGVPQEYRQRGGLVAAYVDWSGHGQALWDPETGIHVHVQKLDVQRVELGPLF